LQIGTEAAIVGFILPPFYTHSPVQRVGWKRTVGEVSSDLIDVITARIGAKLLVSDDQLFAVGELGLQRISKEDCMG
jgi:hypothetical protein